MKEILKLCLPEQLVTLYKIGSFNVGDVDDFLRKVAREKGKLKKDGIHDVATTARIVLRDWNEGTHAWNFLNYDQRTDYFSVILKLKLRKN